MKSEEEKDKKKYIEDYKKCMEYHNSYYRKERKDGVASSPTLFITPPPQLSPDVRLTMQLEEFKFKGDALTPELLDPPLYHQNQKSPPFITDRELMFSGVERALLNLDEKKEVDCLVQITPPLLELLNFDLESEFNTLVKILKILEEACSQKRDEIQEKREVQGGSLSLRGIIHWLPIQRVYGFLAFCLLVKKEEKAYDHLSLEQQKLVRSLSIFGSEDNTTSAKQNLRNHLLENPPPSQRAKKLAITGLPDNVVKIIIQYTFTRLDQVLRYEEREGDFTLGVTRSYSL